MGHLGSFHWRRFGYGVDKPSELHIIQVIGKDGARIATVTKGGSDSPHVQVRSWQSYWQTWRSQGVMEDGGRWRLKVKVKSCYPIRELRYV